MMLRNNLPKIIQETSDLPRVLDVGGSAATLNTATHVVDILPLNEPVSPLSAEVPIRFSKDTCIVHDICRKPWPFPDQFFDYSFCSHTLEDIRDPIAACEELMRVSRRGYIEVPSRLREAFHPKRHYLLRRIFGRPLRIGFGHHRWYCERDGSGLAFLAKTTVTIWDRKHFITRGDLGRDLESDESCIGLFWTGSFKVSERLLIRNGELEADLIAFRTSVMSKTPR